MGKSLQLEALEKRALLNSGPLGAPSALSASASSSTAIVLSWTDNATAESGFKIERSTDGVQFVEINSIGANETTYTNGKLKTGTTYYYRVRAFSSFPAEAGAYSGIASAAPGAASVTPDVPGLEAPNDLKVIPVSSTGVVVRWTDRATAETGYRIERSTDGTNFKLLNTIGPNENLYRNGKLVTGTKYFYRVAPINASQLGAYSNIGKGTVKPNPVVSTPGLAAPTGLSVIPVSSTAIVMRWTDNASGETGYHVERSTDGTNFKLLNTIGPNETTYRNGKLVTGTLYYYRVRAFNASGQSAYSNIGRGTVKPPTTGTAPLAAPTSLAAAATSTISIRLTWKDNASGEKGYTVERSTDGASFEQVATTAANATQLDVGNLAPATKYFFRVRAFDTGRNSGYSNVANASTKTLPPPPPDPDPNPGAHSWASGGTGEYATGRWFFDGVTVTLAADPDYVIPQLKKLHIGSIRTFFNRTETWDPTGGEGVSHAKKYKDAGFRVLMQVGDDVVPTPEQAKTFFQYVAKTKDALKSVDLWQIGNEPNRPSFWKGSAKEYVNNVLKPAWEVFHPLGEKVVGAGPTADIQYAKTLVNEGYLNYVDYADFHPYGSSPEEVYTRAVQARDVFAGKPILFTEWNIRNTAGRDSWAKKVDAARKLLATVGADSAFYFTAFVAETLAGPSGLLHLADYSPNQPFYDMFKKWGDPA